MPPKKQKRPPNPQAKAKQRLAALADPNKTPDAKVSELNGAGLSTLARRLLCDCEKGLDAKDQHGPGAIITIEKEDTIYGAFLQISFPKAKFAEFVSNNGFGRASPAAQRFDHPKPLGEQLRQQEFDARRAAEEDQRRVEEQRRCDAARRKHDKEAAQAFEASKVENAGFVTLVYDNSVEKQRFRKQRADAITQTPERRLTRSSLAVNTSFGANKHDFSPNSPTTNGLHFYAANVPPLTPAETDSRRHSLLEEQSPKMSSLPDTTGGVQSAIKDVIDGLFVLQQHVSSFRAEHQDRLVDQVEDVAKQLSALEEAITKPDNPLHNVKVAPEIIDYVDDGRNPDIFTRDFVELVQRGNAVINGKQKAFRDFSKVFATTLKQEFDGMDTEVDMIMGEAGMEERDGKWIDKELQNGSA